jgi:hypothetical protein
MRAVKAGAIYFAAVFAAGFALGVLRTLALAPLAGPLLAVLVELPVILGFAWLTCVRILHRIPLTRGEAVVMGGVAITLLLAGEVALSMLLARRSLAEHLALYIEAPHLLGLAGQLAFASFPALQVRAGPHAPPCR